MIDPTLFNVVLFFSLVLMFYDELEEFYGDQPIQISRTGAVRIDPDWLVKQPEVQAIKKDFDEAEKKGVFPDLS